LFNFFFKLALEAFILSLQCLVLPFQDDQPLFKDDDVLLKGTSTYGQGCASCKNKKDSYYNAMHLVGLPVSPVYGQTGPIPGFPKTSWMGKRGSLPIRKSSFADIKKPVLFEWGQNVLL
jgi:hypothetical protein